MPLQSYIATELLAGHYYQFRIFAMNEVGYSQASDSIEILTAITPDAPTAVQTEVIANDIRISWTAPSDDSLTDYGSQILSYTVLI